MNLKRLPIPMLMLLILFTSCSKDDDSNLDEGIIIYEDENIKIDLILVADGRCPANINCFWVGNAAIDMKITKGVETVDFTLNTWGTVNETIDFPKFITLFDYEITLLNVEPYPINGIIYSLHDYTITLGVTN